MTFPMDGKIENVPNQVIGKLRRQQEGPVKQQKW